mmetsp:Transcript_60184/g.125915  ORF Transcript_60184/g.125915 Transcript_60184/m.125915 type:complete len:274 (+) Transcript_60184:168-989(+)
MPSKQVEMRHSRRRTLGKGSCWRYMRSSAYSSARSWVMRPSSISRSTSTRRPKVRSARVSESSLAMPACRPARRYSSSVLSWARPLLHSCASSSVRFSSRLRLTTVAAADDWYIWADEPSWTCLTNSWRRAMTGPTSVARRSRICMKHASPALSATFTLTLRSAGPVDPPARYSAWALLRTVPGRAAMPLLMPNTSSIIPSYVRGVTMGVIRSTSRSMRMSSSNLGSTSTGSLPSSFPISSSMSATALAANPLPLMVGKAPYSSCIFIRPLAA